MRNNSLVLICILYPISFGCCVPKKGKILEKLRAEMYQKQVDFEQIHKTAFSSSPEKYVTWPEVQGASHSQCKSLLPKIYPQKDVSVVTSRTSQIKLAYNRIQDRDNKPFPLIEVTALFCGFPKPCSRRTWSYFIRSPDPTCAFFLNRLGGSRSIIFYIAEEICQRGIYPNFWKTVSMVQEIKWSSNRLMSAGEMKKPYSPDDEEKQEQYEREHRQDYLKEPIAYQTWPELDHRDGKVYCHTLFRQFFSGTKFDIVDVKSERGPVMLIYRRIKDKNEKDYAPHRVDSLTCATPRTMYNNRYRKQEHKNSEISKIRTTNPRVEKSPDTMLKVLEIYENRVHFEKKHQSALSSSKQYEIGPKVGNDMRSECERLLRKIHPRTQLSLHSGVTRKIQLVYKRIRDQDNKPFPIIRETALACRHSKPKHYRECIHLIKSPDPKCAFFLNRLGKISRTTFYIADEICEYKKYPKFWKFLTLVEETFAGERKISSPPEAIEKQEQYEREHRQDFLKNPVMYQTWPELDQIDEKLYCHRLLQDFFPRTAIDLEKVKSKRETVILSYRRITNVYKQDYACRKVNALRCSKSQNSFNPTKNGFLLVRAPKSNCILLVTKRHSTSPVFHITRQYCEGEEVTQTLTMEIGMDQVENAGNSNIGDVTEVHDDTFDDLSPIDRL